MLASWLTRPFAYAAPRNALIGGVLVAIICACVGVWVVQRGLAFLGEALGHGLLPGLAIANAAGVSLLLGAAASAAVMVLGVGYVTRRGKVRSETSIGLLFVGMLALGVLIVSRQDNRRELTQFLFGDINVTAAGIAGCADSGGGRAAASPRTPPMASAFNKQGRHARCVRRSPSWRPCRRRQRRGVVPHRRHDVVRAVSPRRRRLCWCGASVAVVVVALRGAVVFVACCLFHQRLAAPAGWRRRRPVLLLPVQVPRLSGGRWAS